ncbi:hypothetical protein BLX41_14010 [Pseudomonas protegens]|nr:hypothetical protein BLX41_14010 [Pseudomonas protegens]
MGLYLCATLLLFSSRKWLRTVTPEGRGQGLVRVSMAWPATAILQMQEVAHGPAARVAYASAGKTVITIGSEFDVNAAFLCFALRHRV